MGTPAYMPPEQLDPAQPIDARTDVYALGVILYELLRGRPPYTATNTEALIAAISCGDPPLPVEIVPSVPEPLQAIALKAMKKSPDRRYQDAREMAIDLRRFLAGRPVAARPTLYRSALGSRVCPHLEQIREWVRLKLIYPHEAESLATAYRGLEVRDDERIVHGRVLSWSQIALYLGAFLLLCGSFLYFDTGGGLWLITNHRGWFDRPAWGTAIVLIGLAVLAAGSFLDTRERQRPRQGSNSPS